MAKPWFAWLQKHCPCLLPVFIKVKDNSLSAAPGDPRAEVPRQHC